MLKISKKLKSFLAILLAITLVGLSVTPVYAAGEVSAFNTIEAESYNNISGLGNEGDRVGGLSSGGYLFYDDIDFGSGAFSFEAFIGSVGNGINTIEIWIDGLNETGTKVGSLTVSNTGDYVNYVSQKCNMNEVEGIHDLYLTIVSQDSGWGCLNWIKFSADEYVETVNAFDIIEAENFDVTSGLAAEGNVVGTVIGSLDSEDYIQFDNIDFGVGALGFETSITAVGSGVNTIEVWIDGLDGNKVATLTVESTGGYENFITMNCELDEVVGIHNVYLKIVSQDGGWGCIDWFRFTVAAPVLLRDAFATIEAESYHDMFGFNNEGDRVGNPATGHFLRYNNIDFGSGAIGFEAFIGSIGNNQNNIEIWIDGLTVETGGVKVGNLTVSNTGDYLSYTSQTCEISEVTGVHDVYLNIVSEDSNWGCFNWFKFNVSAPVQTVDAFTMIEAEAYDAISVLIDEATKIGGLVTDGYLMYNNVDFGDGAEGFEASVTSVGEGNETIEIWIDGTDELNSGTKIGVMAVESTGSYDNYMTQQCNIDQVTGIHKVYLKVVSESTGWGGLDWFKFKVAPSTQIRDALNKIQYENFDSNNGLAIEESSAIGVEGQVLGSLNNSDYVTFYNVDFGAGANSFKTFITGIGSGTNTLQIWIDAIDEVSGGVLAGVLNFTPTSSYTDFTTQDCSVETITGIHDVYIQVVSMDTGWGCLDWFEFSTEVILPPVNALSMIQAENYAINSGLVEEPNDTTETLVMGSLDSGDYLQFTNIDFGVGVNTFEAFITASGSGSIEIWLDGLEGTKVGTLLIPNTGGYVNFESLSTQIDNINGIHDIILRVVSENTGWGCLDWFRFKEVEIIVAPEIVLNDVYTRIEAEDFDINSGFTIESSGTAVGNVNNGNYLLFEDVNFSLGGAKGFEIQLSSVGSGNNYIEVWIGSIKAGTLKAISTGGYEMLQIQSCAVDISPGVYDVSLKILSEDNGWANIDWFRFIPAKRGATLPFTTYEAEKAILSGGATLNQDAEIKVVSSEKSYVNLDTEGAAVEFLNLPESNGLTLRYSIPRDSSGTINLYLNGVYSQSISLSSVHCYDADTASKPRRYDEKSVVIDIPEGASIKLQKEEGNTLEWYAIDLIDLESVPSPLLMPANFLSITEYGAVGDGVTDDTTAITNCVIDAAIQGKGVWIPEGTFVQSSRISIPENVSVKGSGIWYSKIHFVEVGTTWSNSIGYALTSGNTISDIKFIGSGVARDRSAILFRPMGFNQVIQNIWVQNVGCIHGWEEAGASVHDVIIKDSRFIGNYFDGIHWGDGGAFNNLVQNNFFRGLGDDAIAQVNRADMPLCYNNTAVFNTIVSTYWGRGVSNVGGDNLIMSDNIIDSSYLAGVIITTEPLTPSVSRPINGFQLLRNDILRSGHTGHNHAGIQMWLFTGGMKDVVIEDNLIEYGETKGIRIDDTGYGDSEGRTVIKNNIIRNNAQENYDNVSSLVEPLLINNVFDVEAPEVPTTNPNSNQNPTNSEMVDANIKVTSEFNSKNEAVSKIQEAELLKALNYALTDDKGVKTAFLEVPKVDDAKAYVIEFPISALSEEKLNYKVEVKTKIGTVTLPSNMFPSSELEDAKTIALRIEYADTTTLSSIVKAEIGDRPVIELTLKIDGMAVEWDNQEAPVTVHVTYEPTQEELKNPDRIAVWYIDGSGKAIEVPNGKYNPETGMVSFTTTHFSKYAIIFAKEIAKDYVRIYVGDREDLKIGKKIYLYHTNKDNGKLETLPYSSKYKVEADGSITISKAHALDCVIFAKKVANNQMVSLRNQITVIPATKTLYLGGTKDKSTSIKVSLPNTLKQVKSLSDTTLPSGVGGVLISYTSGNKKVAVVNESGLITAVGTGKTNITIKVRLYSGKVKTVITKISVKEPYINLVSSTSAMKLGGTYNFVAKAYGFDTKKMVWTTTQKSKVVINKKNGKATAKSKGTDYVIGKVGNLIKKIKVVVK